MDLTRLVEKWVCPYIYILGKFIWSFLDQNFHRISYFKMKLNSDDMHHGWTYFWKFKIYVLTLLHTYAYNWLSILSWWIWLAEIRIRIESNQLVLFYIDRNRGVDVDFNEFNLIFISLKFSMLKSFDILIIKRQTVAQII